ncbi:hypothetical protein BC332_31689 [Capsicum chinense]|nr:hypothetical protein BC332_31689 [Capsicum chinense]
MEKSWMSCKDRLSCYVYVKGVENFLQFAFKDKESDDKIFCPCAISENTFHQYACNDYLYAFEEDEDFINWRRNDLEVISTDVTLADDIIEDIESEPEIDDEDLLL